MIAENLEINMDKVLLELLKSNDQEFSGGRAKMTVSHDNNKIRIKISAKDKTAHRAMKTSINNTIKILEKTKKVI